jgi:hypothetical protein
MSDSAESIRVQSSHDGNMSTVGKRMHAQAAPLTNFGDAICWLLFGPAAVAQLQSAGPQAHWHWQLTGARNLVTVRFEPRAAVPVRLGRKRRAVARARQPQACTGRAARGVGRRDPGPGRARAPAGVLPDDRDCHGRDCHDRDCSESESPLPTWRSRRPPRHGAITPDGPAGPGRDGPGCSRPQAPSQPR